MVDAVHGLHSDAARCTHAVHKKEERSTQIPGVPAVTGHLR